MKQPLAAFFSVISLLGLVLLYVTPAGAQYQERRLAAVIILSFASVNYTVIMSVIGSNVTGSTKKQMTSSAPLTLYCVVNIVTPQTFLETEALRYPTGLSFALAFLASFIVLTMVTWLSMRLENSRRDKKAVTNQDCARLTGTAEVDRNLLDETDRQNKHFRYSG